MKFSSRHKSQRTVFLIAVLTGLVLSGCEEFGAPPPTTVLNATQRHTGTATLLRVDDAWHPDATKRGIYLIGSGYAKRKARFVPLRGKDDVAGLDVPARIVTDQDHVTVTLNYTFLKFFKEMGGAKAKGEIAMVLSFDAGTTAKNSIVVHSSRGQTLGSFMNFQDWPVIGPVKMDGDSLRMRVVLLELDQEENEQFIQVIKSFASLATTLQPQLGPVFGIATNIAEALIRANPDDVILDQKFALQRVKDRTGPTRSPLLFGKYILLLQEDKLGASGVASAAPRSILPPVVDDLRYDMQSDRLYKVYSYRPGFGDGGCPDSAAGSTPDFPITYRSGEFKLYEGKGRIDYASFFPTNAASDPKYRSDNDYKTCLLNVVNSDAAKKLRSEQLGYIEPILGDLELYSHLDTALKLAYAEGLRHASVAVTEITKSGDDQPLPFIPKGELKFNYPVSQYPEAFTVFAQYPIHTHIVFSVDKSLGGADGEFHEDFRTFEAFLDEQKKTARDSNRIAQITKVLDNALKDRQKQRALMKKVASINPVEKETKESVIGRKVCALWQKGLLPPSGGAPAVLSDAPVYNEIFHLTGEYFDSADEVKTFLQAQPNVTVDAAGTSCTAQVVLATP